MEARSLGIIHTRHRPKRNSMMFTNIVCNVSFGVVDIPKSCAGVCESILLHTFVARNVGLFITLPHPVQGMYIVHVLLSCVPRRLVCRWAFFTQDTDKKQKSFNVFTYGVGCDLWCCRHFHTPCKCL